MERETKIEIDDFELSEPINIVGCSVHIPVAGTPECFKSIGELYSRFFGDGILEKIPNKKELVIKKDQNHFGICHNHIAKGDKIEFTYTIGIQINQSLNDNELLKIFQKLTIPKGDYARIHVSAPSENAIGSAWVEFDKWIKKFPEWDFHETVYEVYLDNTSGWMEFEMWKQILKKK